LRGDLSFAIRSRPSRKAPKLDAIDGIVNMPDRYRDMHARPSRRQADVQ
jgi:hypothetical protein